jgi:hypothetical protein
MKMNETILKYTLKSEEKYNIRYAKKDGALYGGFRTAYLVSYIYAAVFAAFVILGIWFNEEIFTNLNTVYTIGAFLVLGLFGAVFGGFKISLGTALCSIPVSVWAVICFGKLLIDPAGLLGLNGKFYWAHLLPILVMCVSAAVMLIIDLRAKHLLKKGYEKISNRLYAEYSAHAENLSAEEWEEFLKTYDPRPSKKNKENKKTEE